MTSRCEACGSAPGIGFAFCPFCGVARAPAGASDQVPPPSSPPPPSSAKPRPAIAFDRAGTFYQPLKDAAPRWSPGQAAGRVPSGAAPWVASAQPHAPPEASSGPPLTSTTAAGPAPELPLVYLVVRRGPDAAAVHRLSGVALIGRGPGADIALSDSAVAERHGRIQRDPARITFEAVDTQRSRVLSRDGRWIEVEHAVELRDGDTLELGNTQIRLLVVDRPRPSA
jgi:hypothetical protein